MLDCIYGTGSQRTYINERIGRTGRPRFPRGHRNSAVRWSAVTFAAVRLYVDGQFVARIMLPTSRNTRDTFRL